MIKLMLNDVSRVSEDLALSLGHEIGILQRQNERYREGLEFYASFQNLVDANDNPFFDITEPARKALEDD